MPGGALPSLARRAGRNRSAERFPKTSRHLLTPPSHHRVLTCAIPPSECCWGRRGDEEMGDTLSLPVPHGQHLPAAGGDLGSWHGERGVGNPKNRLWRVHQPASQGAGGVMESWSSGGNAGVTTVPPAAACPAQVSPLGTMVQRHLPRSFCRDVAERLTLHPLIPAPAQTRAKQHFSAKK